MAHNRIVTLVAALVFCSQVFANSDYYVSTSGSDSNPGTQAQPFATLQRARDTIRELKRDKDLPNEGVTVWIEAGTYYLDSPLKFQRKDSGTKASPIVYRSRLGHQVRISGAKAVKQFKPVTDPNVLKRLDESVRAKIVCADLKISGISDYGDVATKGNRLELFFRDEPMQIARWPNSGFTKIEEVVGETPLKKRGPEGKVEGKFTYLGDRPQRWTDEQEIWLHGYWFWDWRDTYEKVASIDIQKRVIETTPPWHHYGYRNGQRYYALNLLAELDQPSEWYLDRKTGFLYFLPPEPVRQGQAVVSVLPHLFILEDCSQVTIRDLVLEATRSTAVTISGGTGNAVSGCTIRNTGAKAVDITDGYENSVIGCEIYGTAGAGVLLRGGDRKTLTPAGHRARNNHFHHFGRIYRTYTPAVFIFGVGNQVSHNLIHDGPHNAIQFAGNDHTIEFNEIHHVCFETDDVGSVYTGRDWTARGTVIRHNYFHHIKGPKEHSAMAIYLDDSASGISIIGNLFYKIGWAAFIGGGRDNLIENNIFVECSPSVHVDSRGVGWMKDLVQAGGALPKRLEAMPYKQPPWSEKYPALVNILEESPGLPLGNVVRRNISFNSKWLHVDEKAAPHVKYQDNFVDENPHFVDPNQGNFRLRDDSPALSMGFKPIPLDKIGLYDSENRKSTGNPELVEVKKIWDRAQHSAFTDLIRFRDRWYCAFREGRDHMSDDGKLRVITSSDTLQWNSVALMTWNDGDVRDAKLSVTYDGSLMLSGAVRFLKPLNGQTHQSVAWFSKDGINWSQPQQIGDSNLWMWSVTWFNDVGYSIGYSVANKRFIRLYHSRDARNWDTLADDIFPGGGGIYANETSLVFTDDDTCYCLLRRDSNENSAQLGVAKPPYTNWTWKDLGTRIGGPKMIQLPDGEFIAGVRLYGPKRSRTALCRIDPQAGTLHELLTLPSGGDTSYPGLLWHEGLLQMSYYSSHEGKTSIYLAKIKPP